jgi:hypothetical protein
MANARPPRPRVAGTGPLLLSALLLACQPRLELEPTARPTGPVPVVVASEGGRLPTRPALRTPVPTPTTDLIALIGTVVVAPLPPRTPAPAVSPTPTLAPFLTSTPRPPPARVSGSGPVPRPTATRPAPGAPEPTPAGEIGEPDALEPNDVTAEAVPLALGEEHRGLTFHTPDDVDIFAVPVEEPDMALVVTLSGRPPAGYSIEIVGPRGGNVGRQRVDGTVTLRAVAEIGLDVGTYYVEVRRVGAVLVEGPYSIAASLVGPTASPTVSP